MATWMSNEQFAAIINTYADFREDTARERGAFSGVMTREDQDRTLELAAYRVAADILLNLDSVPDNLSPKRRDEWLQAVDAIKHGDWLI